MKLGAENRNKVIFAGALMRGGGAAGCALYLVDRLGIVERGSAWRRQPP